MFTGAREQSNVPIVQVAHRRHQRDVVSGTSPILEMLAQLVFLSGLYERLHGYCSRCSSQRDRRLRVEKMPSTARRQDTVEQLRIVGFVADRIDGRCVDDQ